MLFSLGFLKFIVFGALILCVLGVVTLLCFLIVDTKKKRIW